ncbi:GNAT family N-acetyltransferase [uncultured Polaribacter sp.]|uniref:GNAT family N-acetyltransferase n=1 Tax=uncultured Polaribacter sp. TaxID=174711 RepID=UPI002621D0C0|nr:GNAT family N-acetyltransferase [uncultured Polaribacter sp.]
MNLKNLKIIPYQPNLAKDFYNLNVEWLKKYFYVEPYDEKVLSNPQKYIIDEGGYIFYATYNDEIIGVAAYINQKSYFELSKMAISPKYRGLKIGLFLINFCVQFAKNKEWESITLYSNTKLVPAINLYKKIGFKEVPLEQEAHYKRSDIKMILNL